MNSIEYLSYVFSGDDIRSATLIQETSLPIDALSIDTLSAEIKCDDDLSSYQQNTPLSLLRDGVPIGTYYLQELKQVNARTWSLRAVSKTGLLDQITHRGGIYTGQTAQEVATEICAPNTVIVKRDIASQQIYGYLPFSTARNNLQQLLFALGANLTIDRDGNFRIANLWNGISAYFTEDEMFEAATVRDEPPVSSVTVVEHSYVAGSDTQVLFDGTTYAGQVITFESPASNITGNGITISESGANYAIVGAGAGTITGNPYVHTTREVTVPVSETGTGNVQRVTDATLVSVVNSAAVSQRLADYYKSRKSIEGGLVLKHREHTGQVARIVNPWTKEIVTATLYDDSLRVSNTTRGDARALVGFLPPQAAAQEIYDSYVILTGSGTWIPDEGVTDIAAVLIGGGNGGDGGSDGENGGVAFETQQQAFPDSYAGESGDGGDGGDGGQGGNILTVNMSVTDAGVVYNCGTGGTGGARNGGVGAAGTATTFGTYTSADGAPSSTGFLNPLTGIVYGVKGVDGVKGGKGGSVQGSGQQITPVYQSGEDVSFGGVIYSGGTSGGHYASSAIGYNYHHYGGLGGGAAAGQNGQNAYVSPQDRTMAAEGGKGGNGAVPTVGNYGDGGGGGHGGGGGGGGGFYRQSDSVWGAWYIPAQAGAGGQGSAGADGGDGCVIVLWRTAALPSSGGLIERKSRFFIDRTGRLIVV